jgi:hypothetical protein
MQDLGYELPRTPILRTPVNKPNKMTQWHICVPESVKVLPAMGTNFHS